jgi:ceramide glucosyltransferase
MSLEILAALIAWSSGLGLTVVGTALALRRLSGAPPHLDVPFGLFPVSVLKPVKGLEAGLEENLRTFFQLDYPQYELLLSVADRCDPAVALIERLICEFPAVRARLLIGDVNVGPNPKVNNLVKGYDQAAHDWILISDSNVVARRDYLKRLVAHLEPGVGIVTANVAGQGAQGLGGRLEATYLNTFYVRMMQLAGVVGTPCVIGKSMLFRRSTAQRFGGIRALARYLAEDYMAGEAMRRLGMRVVTAVDPVVQNIGTHSFGAFWSRHVRWGRLRKSQAPVPFALEPLSSALLSGMLGAYAMSKGWGVPAATFLTAHLGVWSLCDALMMRRMDRKLSATAPAVWFMRELLSLPLWIWTASGSTVSWRGTRLTLRAGGVLAPSAGSSE